MTIREERRRKCWKLRGRETWGRSWDSPWYCGRSNGKLSNAAEIDQQQSSLVCKGRISILKASAFYIINHHWRCWQFDAIIGNIPAACGPVPLSPWSPISPHPIFHTPPSFMLANKSVLCRISQIENKFWFSLWIFSHVVVSEVNVNNGTNILSRCHDRKYNIIPTNLCTDPLNGGSALSPKYRTSAADSFQSSDKLPVFQ